jgi:hypothetical protein
MFKGGWAAGERDHYDTSAPLYRAIAGMSALRKANPVLSRGTPTVLQDNAAQPGALAWRMDPPAEAHASAGGAAFVVFNTAESESLLDKMDTGLPAGSVLEGRWGLHGKPADLTVGAGGRVTLRLPARSGQVWQARTRRAAEAASAAVQGDAAAVTLAPLDALASARAVGDFAVAGTARGVTQLQLVVDGNLASARHVIPTADGRWQALVDTAEMIDPTVRHSVTAWAEGRAVAETRHFQVARAWQLQADVADPTGDDTGPGGRYLYPTDPGWGAQRQMDLQRVKVATAGGALRLDLTMNKVTTPWNPAFGFDHVAYTVFFELPGRAGGATLMPLQDASLPPGMRWHLRLRAHGWSNALFSAEGATASHEGTPVTPGAAVSVDVATHTVSFVLPAAALGRLPSLAGTKIYVTTWDYDGGYRSLAPLPQPFAMGGGAAGEPKVMDASTVIVLP